MVSRMKKRIIYFTAKITQLNPIKTALLIADQIYIRSIYLLNLANKFVEYYVIYLNTVIPRSYYLARNKGFELN